MNKTIKPASLDEWLQWLEELHPSTIDLGLDRVRAVADRLNLDFSGQTVIIVGGTNGKGTSIAMLSEILQAAGYSVGAYTSPHLLVYNERVSCNGQMASDAELCAAFAAVEQVRENISLTYFEYGTLAAMLHFVRSKPDVVILEVGLGGRLDAVNIVEPDLCLLTNVALDHMDWLGDTRDAIGYEKAGIFRAGKPAVYGETDMPATVRQTADKLGIAVLQLNRDYQYKREGDHWQWQGSDAKGQQHIISELGDNGLPLDNAAAVIQGLYQLNLTISPEDIRRGMARARVAGRFQQLEYQGTRVILDVAHNPHAAANLASKLPALAAQGKLCMVLAMLGDKDSEAVVTQLIPHATEVFLAPLQGERGAPVKIIYNQSLKAGAGQVSCYENVAQAFIAAQASAGTAGVVLVTGSFFTVAAVLEML